MARKGAVGGTARWAANGYKAITKQNPGIEATDLYRALIQSRFAVMPNPEHEAFLIGISSQIKGLRGLVVSVLTIEAGFTENTPANQQMFMEIIDEELRNHIIKGSDPLLLAIRQGTRRIKHQASQTPYSCANLFITNLRKGNREHKAMNTIHKVRNYYTIRTPHSIKLSGIRIINCWASEH